jgi:hypothetical protein
VACAHGRSASRRHCVGGSPFIQSRRKVNRSPAGALVRDAVQKLECGQSSAEGGRSGGRRSSPLILFEVRASAACRPRTQRPVAPNATACCTKRNGLLHQTQRVNVDSAAGWIAAAVPLRHASDVPHRYVGWERHLRRARAADVFADSFTYNAHTTSVDVLWAGVPVLSRSAPAPRQQ